MFFANCFDLEQRDRALITSPVENVRGPSVPMAVRGLFSGAVLFVAATCVARTLGPERLAESRDRDSALAGHISGGHGGEDPRRSRQFPGYSATAALSGEDSGLKRSSCGAYPRSFRNFED